MTLSHADLALPLEEVARSFPLWDDDPAPVVAETLSASARDLHSRGYTVWAWTGEAADGAGALVLPVPAEVTREFRPRGPAAVLTRSLQAAADAGAGPRMRAGTWLGFTCLTDPGLDGELAAIALDEAHPAPARVAVARLPADLLPEPDRLVLGPLTAAADLPLAHLAARAGVHPVVAARHLLAAGHPLQEAGSFAPELIAGGRLPGDDEGDADDGPPGIDDDPLPRRRQARRLLRRLFGMKKIGPMHHTAVDHLYRGVPADERAEALEVGEALLRAGLLGEKPSVGQRHVYLRREALPAIHALMERGETDDAALAALLAEEPAPG